MCPSVVVNRNYDSNGLAVFGDELRLAGLDPANDLAESLFGALNLPCRHLAKIRAELGFCLDRLGLCSLDVDCSCGLMPIGSTDPRR